MQTYRDTRDQCTEYHQSFVRMCSHGVINRFVIVVERHRTTQIVRQNAVSQSIQCHL